MFGERSSAGGPLASGPSLGRRCSAQRPPPMQPPPPHPRSHGRPAARGPAAQGRGQRQTPWFCAEGGGGCPLCSSRAPGPRTSSPPTRASQPEAPLARPAAQRAPSGAGAAQARCLRQRGATAKGAAAGGCWGAYWLCGGLGVGAGGAGEQAATRPHPCHRNPPPGRFWSEPLRWRCASSAPTQRL